MTNKKTHFDFKFIRLIGEGSFSSVYLAVDANATPLSSLSAPTTFPSQPIDNVEQSSLEIVKKPNRDNVILLENGLKIRRYAIKVCQKTHIKRERKHKAIMREKEIMNLLNVYPNKHFINLYYTFQDQDRLFFVMTYAQNGELSAYIRSLRVFDRTIVQFYTLQILDALYHLHRLGVVHRDLKPDNLLLDANLNILVTDFGSAQYRPFVVSQNSNISTTPVAGNQIGQDEQINHQNGHQNNSDHKNHQHSVKEGVSQNHASNELTEDRERRSSFVGSAQYVSPEVLQSRPATNMSDLWALGVIVYQMLTGQLPFNAPNEYHVFKRILNLDYDVDNVENLDAVSLAFISSFLKLDPKQRLSFGEQLHAIAPTMTTLTRIPLQQQQATTSRGYESIRRHEFLCDKGMKESDIREIYKHQDRLCQIGRQKLIDELSLLGDRAPQEWRSTFDGTASGNAKNKELIDQFNKLEAGLSERQLLRLMAL